jgi:hypothetical protein
MEFHINESDDLLEQFENKELIGIGSNGNRIYTSINSKNKKVSLHYLIITDIRAQENYDR